MALATELAYVAGFVDGEGCIGIYANGTSLRLSVQIGQKDKSVLEYVQGVMGGSLSFKKYWTLAWFNAEASDMLKQIQPYLMLKRQQAELCIEFMSLAPGMGRRAPTHVQERRLALASQVKFLKAVA